MSRIGKKPVVIPKGVEVNISGAVVSAKGPQGSNSETLLDCVKAEVKDGQILVSLLPTTRKDGRAIHGMSRARINNLVEGVAKGFSKDLDIIGLGYRAEAKGQTLHLTLGMSHPVTFDVPKDVKVVVSPKKTAVTFSSFNKDLVGQTAASFRDLKPPEPYKGVGIRYHGEHVRRKAGKTAAGAGAKK